MATLSPGELLNNRYQIEKVIAQGGMGAIYQATDTSLGVTVAVKENLVSGDEQTRQFHREASLLAGLRHPNLPRVTDHFIIPERGQYLVMDFIQGEDLRDFLTKNGPLPEMDVLRIASVILDAINYLHNQKPPVIHRDIKPGNIRITEDGDIFLVDFGLAKYNLEGSATTTGAQGLTPGYAPPEQYGAGTDARADIYSLGATMYALLTNMVPPDAFGRLMGSEQITPIRTYAPAISQKTEALIFRAIEPEREKRFQTASKFKSELDQITLLRNSATMVNSRHEPWPSDRFPDDKRTRVHLREETRKSEPHSYRPEPPIYPEPEPPRKKPVIGLAIAAIIIFIILIGIGVGIFLFINRDKISPVAESTRTSTVEVAVISATTIVTEKTSPTTKRTAQPDITDAIPATIKPTVQVMLPTNTKIPTNIVASSSPVPPTSVVQVVSTTKAEVIPPTRVSTNTQKPTVAVTKKPLPTQTIQPTTTRTRTPSPTFTLKPSSTPTPTIEPSATNTEEPTPTDTLEPSLTPSPEPLPTEPEIVEELPGGGTGQIAFVSERGDGGIPQIWIVDSDGKNMRQITRMKSGACQPSFSPDGNRLVFISPCKPLRQRDLKQANLNEYMKEYEGSALFLIGVNGRGMQPIPSVPGGDYDPAWSPDGKTIAFTSVREKIPHIYLLDVSTRKVFRGPLAKSAGERRPVWSPDSKTIAYETTRLSVLQIWMMNSDGSNAREFSLKGDSRSRMPAWSPDGSILLFNQGDTVMPYFISKEFGNQLKPEAVVPFEAKGRIPMRSAAFSVDGSWVAYESWPDGKNHFIYIMLPTGGELTPITPLPLDSNKIVYDYQPVWQPGSR